MTRNDEKRLDISRHTSFSRTAWTPTSVRKEALKSHCAAAEVKKAPNWKTTRRHHGGHAPGSTITCLRLIGTTAITEA